jgi:hypothetical protein
MIIKPPTVFILVTTLISCSKTNIDNAITNCLDHKINAFKKASFCSNAQIDKFFFNGDTVYTLDPGTCGADMSTEVIGADCKNWGYLGGISGNTQINGKEFSTATFIKTIWKK